MSGAAASPPAVKDGELARVMVHVFEDMKHLSRQHNHIPVIVYLPMGGDYRGGESDKWRRILRHEAERRGLFFVDLVEHLRTLAPGDLRRMFIKGQIKDFPSSAGHYTEAGNLFIAQRLYAEIMKLRAVHRRLWSDLIVSRRQTSVNTFASSNVVKISPLRSSSLSFPLKLSM